MTPRPRTIAPWIWLGAAALLAGCAPAVASPASDPAAEVRTPQPRTLILSAFGDVAATYGESRPFLEVLQGPVDRSSESAYCSAVVDGTISGQPVTVVVTGTGSDNSGPCAQEMLGWYAPGIREVIWSGIGGATPAVGGLVRRDGRRVPDPVPVMIGDVCISAVAWNYDLHFSNINDWAAARSASDRYGTSGGWWPMKNSEGKADVPGFEGVQQFVIADRGLADDLLTAAESVQWPAMTAGVREKVMAFFTRRQIRPVRAFDYTQCGEIASNDFWHGATEDRLARRYLASVISASGYRQDKARPRDVVVFSAMEATAWMSVVARWNAHKGTAIPMAVIRGASNYDQVPLDRNGNPVRGRNGKPLTAMQDILDGFKEAGSAFASQTAAAPVLALLASRATS